MTKRFGFTLAEVLITLAIIGVVAAMTMPTLINSTSATQFKTAFKKGLSVLSQAVVMNIALDDYDLSGTYEHEDDDTLSVYNIISNRTNATDITEDSVLDNYTVYINEDDPDETTSDDEINYDSNYIFRFNDGIIFSFPQDTDSCTEEDPCYGWIDANGIKGPNKAATCTTSGGDDELAYCTSKVTVNDIFPVKFYDQTFAPASASARAVMYGTESRTISE